MIIRSGQGTRKTADTKYAIIAEEICQIHVSQSTGDLFDLLRK
jgi:hypothetical protein